METGLYKKHGGHFLIVTHVAKKYVRMVSTQAGELQLHKSTEDQLINEGYAPCDSPSLAEAITKFAAHPGGISEAAKAALLDLKERNMDVKAATTKELVDFYNKHSESPIKKFKDRETAEKRVQALLDTMPQPQATAKPKKDGSKPSAGGGQRAVTVIVKRAGKELAPKEFRSVISAFDELGLSRSKMSKFRKEFWAGKTNSIEDGKDVYEFRA